MTIELLGVDGWTVENKALYEKRLLMRAVPMFRYAGLGLQRPIPANGSNNIEFRVLQRPSAATTPLTQGTPPTETQTTWSNVAATVAQYGAYVKVSDVALSQSIDPVLSEHTKMFGEHMADTLDRIARAVLVAGTNVQYADSATSRGALTKGNVLDEGEIRTAIRNLRRRDAKPLAKLGGKYALIIPEDSLWADLLADTTIQNVLQNAGVRGDQNPYFTGSQFDYLGVSIMPTSNAPAISGAGLSLAAAVHVYQSVMLGEEAYGEVEFGAMTNEIIVNPVGSAGAADPLHQFGTIGWKAAYAARILNQAFLQRIEHATSSNQLPVNA